MTPTDEPHATASGRRAPRDGRDRDDNRDDIRDDNRDDNRDDIRDVSGRDGRIRRRVETIARLTDDAVEIPLIGVRVGIDPLLGLLPGWGDALAAALSGWIVVDAARLGAGPTVLLRMLLNLGMDALVGVVPLLGDLFDAGYRANRRNVRLLERHLDAPTATRTRSRLLVWSAGAAVIGFSVGLFVVATWLAATLWGLLGG